MDDTALLTDDEIVAICASDGRPWPFGLPTVETTTDDLTRAGMRGMRSLMVRHLAHRDAGRPGMHPHKTIVDTVGAFLDANERVGAYIAPASDHAALGGASVTTARTEDGWVVDTSTAAGIHALRLTSADDAAAAVLALVEHSYSGTIFTDSSSWVCVVTFGAENCIVIGPRSVSGLVDGSPVDSWSPDLIRGIFR